MRSPCLNESELEFMLLGIAGTANGYLAASARNKSPAIIYFWGKNETAKKNDGNKGEKRDGNVIEW